MELKAGLKEISEALKKEDIAHGLIGGLALAAHGVVRATVDIDLLVDGNKKQLIEIICQNLGFKTVHKTEEVLQLSGRYQLDILFANRPKSKQMLTQTVKMMGFPLPVVAAEDIIGLKIQAYKNDPKRELQDKADIQALMTKIPSLDFTRIKGYADLYSEWSEIERLRKL
jgi:hypothetical protein